MEARKALVLVEGKGDEAVIKALIAEASQQDHVEVVPTGTVDGKAAFARKLRAELEVSRRLTTHSTLVIVRDCDDDPETALGEAQQAFRATGLPVPSAVGKIQSGTWATQGTSFDVATAVWLIPGIGKKGNLESLLLQSLTGEKRLDCVSKLLDCWQTDGVATPESVGNADRQRMQVWLSQFVDKKGYILLGSSMSSDHVSPPPWNFSHSAFAPTIDFLRTL